MELLSKTDLEQLANYTDGPCVSFYLPTHRAGPDTRQDPVRLRNLLRKAEFRLQTHGKRGQQFTQFLRPAYDLLDNRKFWQHQEDGLAILMSPGLFRIYRMQMKVPELVVTSERFHLKPLLSWISAGGHYYVLALTQEHARVFHATRQSMLEMETLHIPHHRRRVEGRLQIHASVSRPGRRATTFHGHGSGAEERKEVLLNRFGRLDERVGELLSKDRAPVVLAGVDYLCAIYRQASSHAELLEHQVSGNPESLSPRELHQKADAIASDYFEKDRERAADQYEQLRYTGRTSADLGEILPAARQGRVQLLFVAVGVQLWGRFDDSTNETSIFGEAGPDDQDLLNLAAIESFLTGGFVYAVNSGDVPGGRSVAAVFRY